VTVIYTAGTAIHKKYLGPPLTVSRTLPHT
jgi:hypothetical protein